MAMSSSASTPSVTGGLRYAPFGLDVYLHDYEDYVDTGHLGAIL